MSTHKGLVATVKDGLAAVVETEVVSDLVVIGLTGWAAVEIAEMAGAAARED